jgi:hypothetical protein
MAVFPFVEMVGLKVTTRSIMRDQIPSPDHKIGISSHIAAITTTIITMHLHRYQAGSHLHLESQDSQEARLHLHQAHIVPTPTRSPTRRNLAPRPTAISTNLRCRNSDIVRPTITEIIAMDVLIMGLLVMVDIKELHEFENFFAGLSI